MVNCAIVGCSNDSRKKSDVSFYQLPKEELRKKAWLNKIGREKKNLPKDGNIYVCHVHFTKECFERDLKNELLGIPQRRILTKEAIPTIVPHQKNVSKRLSSEKRECLAAKQQCYEDAMEFYTLENEKTYQINTKSIQTEYVPTKVRTIATQTGKIVQKNFEAQHFPDKRDASTMTEKCYYECKKIENDIDGSEIDKTLTSEVDSDSSFCISPIKEKTNETFYEGSNKPALAYIVFWSALLPLFKHCLNCGSDAKITDLYRKGSALIVELVCNKHHQNIWRSQPLKNWYYRGNVILAASVLFSSNTFAKISKYFSLANIPWISESRFYALQRNYFFGIANEAWLSEQDMLLTENDDNFGKHLSGDGRCDSPGYNAKYLTYSLLDQTTGKILAMSVTQCTETGTSNRMEKTGFIKVLNEIDEKNVKVKQITTDRHIQIKKYMREERPDICHQFDIWHVSKNIKQKILKASKKKSCQILAKWLKSICNHFWWACATCEGDVVLLQEKWTSVIFHIQNIHYWTGYRKFMSCSHTTLTPESQRSKEWIRPDSEAFLVLQKIVFDKTLLGDLVHLTNFSHTGMLEVYHSLYNKWIPKSVHFSFRSMVARSQLAAIDFNSGTELKQATTSKGDKRFRVTSSKITKAWSAKPIKEKKSGDIFRELVYRAVDVVEDSEYLPVPEIPDLPDYIADTPKPSKDFVLKNQLSRFNKSI